jgi:hypothetical protein
LRNWNRGRKYHSGRGTYVEFEGSAGNSSPAGFTEAKPRMRATTTSDTIASLATMSGQKNFPPCLVAAYAVL